MAFFRVLMLGWEYPPHISGGLGTACQGLSSALAKQGIEIDFVVPQLFGDEDAEHMNLLSASRHDFKHKKLNQRAKEILAKFRPEERIRTVRVQAALLPYLSALSSDSQAVGINQLAQQLSDQNINYPQTRALDAPYDFLSRPLGEVLEDCSAASKSSSRYGRDLFAEVRRFTDSVVELMRGEEFDIIHAHDWMTFPAAIALSRISGAPCVLHVHSLEYDRSGGVGNQRIQQIERWGLENADKVVAVSYFTRRMIHEKHAIALSKIEVVHNGVYLKHAVDHYRSSTDWGSKVVLFLGRVTLQKGPDYFVEAAAKVVPHVPDVTFVVAGAGDMLPGVIARVHQLGMEKNFIFTGFLKGEEVEQMFSLADLYVMPSVSEPFGISALEAISCETPVILSKQTGVAEVLRHVLKADFWDIDRLAELMINALLHDQLRADMIAMAREEVKRVHWELAASKTVDIYDRVLYQGRS